MLISKFEGKNVEKRLNELIKKYGITITSDYRGFLLKYNGGETLNTKFHQNNVSTDVRGFFGFTENKNYSFSNILEYGLGESLIHRLLLPIATNVFGDYIVMNVSENKNGEILFVYHDNPKKIIKISPNFKDFIDICKSEKIGHVQSIEERKQCLIENGIGDKINEYTIKGWQAEIDKYNKINQEEVNWKVNETITGNKLRRIMNKIFKR